MKNTFSKLNKKMRGEAFVKALAFGCGLGLSVAAAALAVQKGNGNAPQILPTALPAVIVLILATAVALLILRPTEKRNAKILDRRLALGEKVQTMVAFAGQNGDILEIQREDTKKILSETPKKRFRNSRGWMHAILPLVATLLFTGAMLMPVLAAEGPGDNPIDETELWSLTDWHISAVRELIENVKASEMNEDGKEQIVEELEAMLTDLTPVTTVTAMKNRVFSAMIRIDGTVDGINTFTVLIDALNGAGKDKVTEFAEAIGTPSDPIVESKYAALRVSFLTASIKEDLFSFSQAIGTAIDTADVPEDDLLYTALKAFAAATGTFEPNGTEQPADADDDREDPTEDPTATALTALFEGAAAEISEALRLQNINRTVSDNTINALMSVFGIAYSELPEELTVRDDKEASGDIGDYEDKQDDILNPGGMGGGEILYGSDDAIYDPDGNEYVRYGEVIDEYNGKKTEILEDGGLADTLKDFIDRYFADLYNKNKED